MACGTSDNAYRTLESLVLVLPSGTVIDTGAADADERLRALERDLYEGLERLRDRVRGNPESVRIIEHQFSMKNTMGYGLNGFLDHTRPVDLLTRLAVGSEGTLAFVAEATFRTVPLHAHALTGLLVFADLAAATGALPALLESPADDRRAARRDLAAGRPPRPVVGGPAAGRRPRPGGGPARGVPGAERRGPGRARRGAIGAAHRALPTAAPAALSRGRRPPGRALADPQGPVRHGGRPPARPGPAPCWRTSWCPVGRLLDTCTALTGLFDRHGYARQRDLRACQGRQRPLHAHRPVRPRRTRSTCTGSSPTTSSTSCSARAAR